MEEFCVFTSTALPILVDGFNHSNHCSPFEAEYFVNLSVT